MHIKFLAHGTGDPHIAVTYLLSSRDHAGRPRAEVIVLRGNPALVTEVAAGLGTVHRYSSGVIGWAREDEPTDAEIDAVVNDFERTAFAGLEAQQYSWCVIQHTDDDGGKHVHVLAARAELHSGKALNIAPPGWQKTFDPLRDYWNHTKGWARPDDRLRSRAMQPGRWRLASVSAGREAAAISQEAEDLGIHVSDLNIALAVEPDPKRWITDWLLEQIFLGDIENRDDLLEALKSVGTLNRIGANYVSIRLEGHSRPMRLQGSIYGEDFNAAAIRERMTQPRDLIQPRGEPDPQAAEQARRDLDAAIERRAAYNRQRFPAPSPLETSSSHPASEDQGDPQPPIADEAQDDRTRNTVIEQVERALQFAREAVRGFVKTCAAAIRSSDHLGRTGRLAERASLSAIRARIAAERASGAIQRAAGARQGAGQQALKRPDELTERARSSTLPRR